jgi:hypothetical protein
MGRPTSVQVWRDVACSTCQDARGTGPRRQDHFCRLCPGHHRFGYSQGCWRCGSIHRKLSLSGCLCYLKRRCERGGRCGRCDEACTSLYQFHNTPYRPCLLRLHPRVFRPAGDISVIANGWRAGALPVYSLAQHYGMQGVVKRGVHGIRTT